MAHRPRPSVAIPPGTAPPTNTSPSVVDPPLSPINLWADRRYPLYTPYTPTTSNYASSSYLSPRISLDVPARPHSRASSAYEVDTSRISFPEPQLYRSSSQRSSYRPNNNPLAHRSSRSESILSPDSVLTPTQYSIGGDSGPPSFETTPEFAVKDLSSELSNLSVDSDEGLRKFQSGQLSENDEEWYRLVPPEAREVLDKKEVTRQSILFEIVKSEKDYVADLELVKEVFVDPLKNTHSVPGDRVEEFIKQVFFNLDDILAHHQRMLASLYARQREQFPLVQSLADIILDNSLLFCEDYEEYIKHYPIAEMRHRSEMRRNQRYQYFLQQCSQNPNVRKRDIITFISRPVTRLPRLHLLLQNVRKYTEPDHPDMEAIPLLLGILNDFIKSTQPGIEAAEEKVRFWSLCESLVYQKGEIMDLGLYDESRSLRHQGMLSRRYKSEMNYHWADLHVALLDNYLLLLKPETRPSDSRAGAVTKHHVVSRPIPLDYLKLGDFEGSPENRKEKAEEGSLGLLDRVRPRYKPMFPFTIYHESARMSRRYTLYAASESERDKWKAALDDTLKLREYRQEGNMYFVPHTLNDGFFKHAAPAASLGPSAVGSHFTGPVTAATTLHSNNYTFVAVACPSGIYIAQKGEPAFRKLLNLSNPSCMVALQDVNKFFVLHDQGLYSYSLDLVGRAALGSSDPQNVEATRERIATDVVFFRAGKIGSQSDKNGPRYLVLYAAKSFLQLYLYALGVVKTSELNANPRRSMNGLYSFRPFGEPLSIPKDTHDISVLGKRVLICSEKSIIRVDPANLHISGSGRPERIPNFSDADNTNTLPLTALKGRCASAKPLGAIACGDELLVVYDELGCYTDKDGIPTRQSGYLRWETKAVSFAHHGEHILLFSPQFIEIRTVRTGELVQVIEGTDIRRVDVGLLNSDKDAPTIIAKEGTKEQGLVADALEELMETTELSSMRTADLAMAWADW